MNENDNILTLDRSDTPQPPAQPAGGYPLDWETTQIRLKEGRFTLTMRRPTPELIFERELEIQSEIPLAKDGSFTMPDPTASEDVDAKYFDKLIVESSGYAGVIPSSHKAAAFQGLYQREIYVDDDTDPFAEQVEVLEEIGTGDEPDFTIVHLMRQPTEAELKRYRRRSATGGSVKPGKRGKQRFVTKSNLKDAVEAYDQWCVMISGATVAGSTFATPDHRATFLASVDPLIKRKVVAALVEAIVGSLLD